MHHEKYVLVVILDRLRRMEHTKEDSDGNAVIAGRNFDRKSVRQYNESGKSTHMASKPTHRSERNLDEARDGYNNK